MSWKKKCLSVISSLMLAASVIALPCTALASEPVINSVQVTDVTSAGYRVTVSFSSGTGIRKVMMPTWTAAGGKDDLIWHQAYVNGNAASWYIASGEHKNESGKYITHIYVYDSQGNYALRGVETDVPAAAGGGQTVGDGSFSVGQITVSEVSASGYRVTAKLNSPDGVQRVLMPTWTEANGQDDLIWHEAQVSGDAASFYVKVSDHKGESGTYITHIYLYDSAGRQALVGTKASVPAASGGSSGQGGEPYIGTITISEISSAGYRVTAQISAPAGVQKVEMPTWTEANGQDDLVWHQAQVSGNTAVFYVPASAHKNESGKYITHVYLYNNAGNKVLKGTQVTVPASGGGQGGSGTGSLTLSVPYITSLNSTGYTIQVTFSAPAGVQRVSAAVWTSANGQDDLVWHEMTVSGNTATVRVPVSAHKYEHGIYITNVYIWDYAGGQKMTDAAVPVP